MDFYAVLDQVLALLRQRGRVSYRALQRQFDLDDAALADLQDALVFAEPCVVDEAGRGLVWTGVPPAAALDTRQQAEAERQFHTVLLAVMALLQREQRVTYRTLHYVFGVDEACLHAVRDELHFRQLAREEGGQGLVWTGKAPPPAATAAVPPLMPDTAMALSAVLPRPPLPPPVEPRPLPGLPPALDGGVSLLADHVVPHPPDGVPALTPALARSAPEAERRQLTVLFCDLVGSTQLSGQLDPEDLRAVVRAYQEAAAKVIQHYAGYIAQYLGDGLLVYFGYPTAHEDEARRAVHTGLGIVQAIATLNTLLTAQYSVSLAVRLGIHTGPVVVGVMGGGGRHEHLALGETPNIAARLQALAPANAVVISAVTARLVQGTFHLEDLGPLTLAGVAEPMALSRVRGVLTTPSHDEEFVTATVPVLVGREEESGLLRRRWDQSTAGLGQVVFISGEAGIGKSALVEGLRAQVRAEGLPRLAFRCSPYHTTSALYPVITHLERLLQYAPDDSPAIKLAKLEAGLQSAGLPLAEVVPLFAGLLSVPLPAEHYATLTVTPQQQKQQMLDALVAWLAAEAERQPVLVAWEDLHWADPSTLEVLGLVIEQAPTVPMLHVLTYRPEFSPPWLQRSQWRFYLARAQLGTARELGETLLRLAHRAHDSALAVIAHYALGLTSLYLGALPAARTHLEEGIVLYTPDQRRVLVFRTGQDPGVACRIYAAMTLWLLGYPEQALARTHDALALAHALVHPFSLGFARAFASFVYQFCRDVPATHEQAEAAVVLATEQGFPVWAAHGMIPRGWALAMQGQGEEGLALVHQGIAAWRAPGAAVVVPYLCAILAEVYDRLGLTEDGIQALAEAHTLVEQQEERWWEAEIARLRGVLLLRQTIPLQAEAETCLQRALDVARRQEAKSLELRAAMSLARLWQQQGKQAEAHAILASVYGWFTEGFDTADLQEAKALLDELA